MNRPDPDQGFEPVDHTADRALRVWAPDLESLFLQAARGLASLLTDPSTVERRERRSIELAGIDREELLVAWLGEILYRHDAEHLLLAHFDAVHIECEEERCSLRAVAFGEARDPARHSGGTSVKAATYHGLRVVPDEDGRYAVTIVFDA
ncbi:MAG: archease [Candidatus Eisenbacteria bacterium]|nr:archease [Candidatus Eisenbacteria bacterium]